MPDNLSEKRILVVGSNAGYDAFMFRQLGAESILACEPSDIHRQAIFLESIYQTGIDFRQIGWQDLGRKEHGLFDLIQCHGVFHRELHPMLMLGRLSQLLAPQAIALIGSPLLPGGDTSQYVRFVQEEHEGHPGWWWLPGRKALRRMLRVAGLAVRGEFDVPGEVTYFKTARVTPADGDAPVAAQAAPVAGEAARVVAKFAYPPGHFYSAEPDPAQARI